MTTKNRLPVQHIIIRPLYDKHGSPMPAPAHNSRVPFIRSFNADRGTTVCSQIEPDVYNPAYQSHDVGIMVRDLGDLGYEVCPNPRCDEGHTPRGNSTDLYVRED